MSISRLRMGTDGNGICTLVLFYNCPLQCAYCINTYCHSPYVTHELFTPEKLLKKVKLDQIYFRMTGGGITFGGGEPIFYSEFIHRFSSICDKEWNMRIETSLNCDWGYIEWIYKDIDEWFIDIKDMNPEIYQAYTGSTNEKVIRNLKRLSKIVEKEKLHIRVPRIPGYNTEKDIEYSQEVLKEYVTNIEVFDYLS